MCNVQTITGCCLDCCCPPDSFSEVHVSISKIKIALWQPGKSNELLTFQINC